MSDKLSELAVKVIGVVRNEMKEPGIRPNIQEVVSEIEIFDSYADGLEKLDEYSHVMLIYWYHLDRRPDPKPMRQHPHNQEKYPMVGIFALRGSDRPNRIGTSMAKLLEVGSNRLKISGSDALDGSPVLDIKPYISRIDSIPGAKESSWQLEWDRERER